MAPNIPQPILPFYLVLDVSWSMNDDMDIVNEAIRDIGVAVVQNSILSDKTRFAIVTFSDVAKIVLPLGDLAQQSHMPVLSVEGGTSYGAAFTALRATIQADVDHLKADGCKVHRPAVFFVSDGEPQDASWEAAFAQLTTYDKATEVGFPYYPLFIPFGVRDASTKVIHHLIHPPKKSRGFMQKEGRKPGEAFKSIVEIIIGSLLSSESTADGSIAWDRVDTSGLAVAQGDEDTDIFL